MDIYDRSASCFSSLPVVSQWEEAQSLFCRIATGKPDHWRMPLLACEAVGGMGEDAFPAVTAIACAHIGIILVDDMLDADPRGEYRRVGMPAAANLACAFQAASLQSLACAGLPAEARFASLDSLNAMFLSTALGQFRDVQSPKDEETYWRVTQTKSSPFFGAAFQIGGLMGGASIEIAERLKELGALYGEMIQIHDDLNDSLALPANPDWIQGRAPLPILFAKLVDHPDRARFLKLCHEINAPGALEEAQEILIRCGAVGYCVDQLTQRDDSARAMLDALPLVRRERLDELFERVIAPVWKLFETIGKEDSEALAIQASSNRE